MEKQNNGNNNREREEVEVAAASPESEMHVDLLEAIFSRLSLIHLVPASRVCKAWNRAVFSSLRRCYKVKPWLMVHTQRKRPPHTTATHAYDPRSRVWVRIKQPPLTHVSELRSSHSTLVYTLSPTRLSFSLDPLHLTWHHLDVPLSSRTDPIVAAVGDYIVLAGGASGLGDDPLSVEIYNLRKRTWERCQNMPAILKDSAASTWLSVAADSRSRKIHVSEKFSGVTYSLDPETKTWSGAYDLRPDQNMFFSAIAFACNRLILVGLTGVPESVEGLKLWEVKGGNLEELTEVGEMPEALLEKLRGSTEFYVSSVSVTAVGDAVYIHNNSEPEEIVVCEIGEGGVCQWNSIKNIVVNDESRVMDRLVFSCCKVTMADLQSALTHGDRTFVVKEVQC